MQYPKLIFVLCASLLVGIAHSDARAQNTPQILHHNIKSVTVFLEKAQLTREGTTTLNAGKNTLCFQGLPASLDASNIQISASGAQDITILSVRHNIDYLQEKKRNPEQKQLEVQQNILQDSLVMIKKMIAVYDAERAMLIANQSISGEEKGVVVQALKEAMLFFRTRLTEISRTIYHYEKNQQQLTRELENIKKQLAEYQVFMHAPSSSVTLIVASKTRTQATFSLQYIVPNAHWKPVYDIRIKDISEPLQLIYKAQIAQQTGEDWKDVELIFSTANPAISNHKPELDPEYVDFMQARARNLRVAAEDASVIENTKAAPMVMMAKAPTMSVENRELNVIMRAAVPYSLSSNGKTYDVVLQSYDVPATYSYVAVPKKSSYAYLLARIATWADYHLLDGTARVFFQDAYQGESFLRMQEVGDTLSLSVGRDNDMVISRKRLKDMTSKKVVGATEKWQQAYEISLRNNKKTPVLIRVEDQLPRSKNADIQISDAHYKGAQFNEADGKLIWTLSIPAGASDKIVFDYTLKYPKNKRIRVW